MNRKLYLMVSMLMLFYCIEVYGNTCQKVGVLGQFYQRHSSEPFRYGEEILEGVKTASKFLRNKKACYEILEFDIGEVISNIPDVLKKAETKGVKYLIGLGLSDQVRIALDDLKKKEMLLFTPTASDQTLNQPNNPVIMMFPSNQLIGKKLGEFAKQNKLKNIKSFYAENYSVGVDVKRYFDNYSGQSERNDSYKVQSKLIDLTNYRNEIKRGGDEYFFVPLLEIDVIEVIKFIISERKNLPRFKGFIGTNGWGNYFELVDRFIGPNIDVFVPEIYNKEGSSELNNYFQDNIKLKSVEHASHLGAFSFDALLLLDKMIEKCLPNKYKFTDLKCKEIVTPIQLTTGQVSEFLGNSLMRDIAIINIGKKK